MDSTPAVSTFSLDNSIGSQPAASAAADFAAVRIGLPRCPDCRDAVATIGWSHFVELIPLKDALARDFYAEMCRVEQWSVRQLRERIDSMLYEFRDPYMLDFLDLADTYSEKDLESAILREIERFLLELGAGFAFVERQKRITIDGDDYYLDLLFCHQRMQRLVAIELKLGDFKPADSGQMELYLRWLDRHERQPSEQAPLGIILCAGKKRVHRHVADNVRFRTLCAVLRVL